MGGTSIDGDADLREWSETMRREVDELRRQLAESEAELARCADLEARLAAADAKLNEYEVMVTSASWRLTRPLRSLASRLRRSRP